MNQIKRNIEIAKLAGSESLIVHAGHIANRLELDFKISKKYKGRKRSDFNISKRQIQKQFSQLIQNLNEVVYLGKLNSIKIALENNGEYYQFGSNLEEYYKILTKVKGLKSSISTGHANISGNNVHDYISKCKSKIINLDLHDNHGKKDEHLPIGCGNINFKRILRQLKNKKNLTLLIDTYTNQMVKKSITNLQGILKTI